ncbi:MAG: RNA polymerase sigma-I factor [Bacillota bacterium]|nr:MAG: RNA polymerase sigma-I factor [Bacillota bacterium]
MEGPEGLLGRARGGDDAARETLLRRYSPFALKVASRVTGGYVQLGRDDEASVALMAFNEAIDSYDPSRGASFLGFVQAVIRRRLIDYFRQAKAKRREVPMSALRATDGSDEGWAEGPGPSRLEAVQAAAAEWAHADWQEASDRRDEVARFRELLDAYGISLHELTQVSPRHEDARHRAIQAARALAARPDLVSYLRQRGELPLKDLERLVRVSRKTLERQRKYIIAVTLILTEELPHLEAYLK